MSSDWDNVLWDDFNGGAINADLWDAVDGVGAGASGIIASVTGGAAYVTTGGNLNDWRYLRMLNTFGNYYTSKNFVYAVRLKVFNAATTYNMWLQMYNGAAEYIKFEIGTDTPNGAISTTRTGGVSTTENITHSHDTDFHKLTIVGRSSSVKFLIDDSLKQTHTTNITATSLHPWVGIKTLVAATRTIYIDYIFLKTDRDT